MLLLNVVMVGECYYYSMVNLYSLVCVDAYLWWMLLQLYGGESAVKSVLPSAYQAMVIPGQYQYMARIYLFFSVQL